MRCAACLILNYLVFSCRECKLSGPLSWLALAVTERSTASCCR